MPQWNFQPEESPYMRMLSARGQQQDPLAQSLVSSFFPQMAKSPADYDPMNLALLQLLQSEGPRAALQGKRGLSAGTEDQVLNEFLSLYGRERGLQEYEQYKNKIGSELLKNERAKMEWEAKKGMGHEVVGGKIINELIRGGQLDPKDTQGQAAIMSMIRQFMGTTGGNALGLQPKSAAGTPIENVGPEMETVRTVGKYGEPSYTQQPRRRVVPPSSQAVDLARAVTPAPAGPRPVPQMSTVPLDRTPIQRGMDLPSDIFSWLTQPREQEELFFAP